MTQYSKLLLLISFFISSLSLLAQKEQNVFSSDTATIKGKKYIGVLNYQGLILLNSKHDTVLQYKGDYWGFHFRDFNKDGYKDIFLDHGGNTPERYSLFIFLPLSSKFKEIKDFELFPDPKQIKGTKYYYSYHKSGCADSNWDSDLFYINNFRAIRLGNIAGRECNNRDIKDAIYIYRVHQDKKSLLKIVPIDILKRYKDFKWGFIKDYWTRNCKL